MLQLVNSVDIPQVMKIIADAKVRMKLDNLIQWQDGYPNLDTITSDIGLQQLYKLEIDGQIAGICVINDDYYEQYQGTPDKQQCLMIHRFAVNTDFLNQGIGQLIIEQSCEIIKSRGFKYAIIDTNSENHKMVNLIIKSQFKYVSDFSLVPGAPVWQVFVKQLSV